MFHVSKTLKRDILFGKVKWQRKSSTILKKFDKGFLSLDIFILRFEKSNAAARTPLD